MCSSHRHYSQKRVVSSTFTNISFGGCGSVLGPPFLCTHGKPKAERAAAKISPRMEPGGKNDSRDGTGYTESQ